MSRPRKVIRTVNKHLSLPENVVAQVDLQLFSEVEGRIPTGAYQELVTALLMEWLRDTVNKKKHRTLQPQAAGKLTGKEK